MKCIYIPYVPLLFAITLLCADKVHNACGYYDLFQGAFPIVMNTCYYNIVGGSGGWANSKFYCAQNDSVLMERYNISSASCEGDPTSVEIASDSCDDNNGCSCGTNSNGMNECEGISFRSYSDNLCQDLIFSVDLNLQLCSSHYEWRRFKCIDNNLYHYDYDSMQSCTADTEIYTELNTSSSTLFGIKGECEKVSCYSSSSISSSSTIEPISSTAHQSISSTQTNHAMDECIALVVTAVIAGINVF
eukprot:147810_1